MGDRCARCGLNDGIVLDAMDCKARTCPLCDACFHMYVMYLNSGEDVDSKPDARAWTDTELTKPETVRLRRVNRLKYG